MSQLSQKIKILYGKIDTRPISYERRGMRPKHDWNILLAVSCLVLLLETLFAFYFYTGINQGKLFIVAENNMDREVKINNNLLQKIVSEIKLRQKSMDNIKQNEVVPPDPSL